MIVVDSSVWIDFCNGTVTAEVELLRTLIGQRPLLVGDLMLLEVQGVADERQARQVEGAVRQFDVAPMRDPDLALQGAANDRRLRRRTLRKTIDLIIGTFCIASGHTLLTRDRDFVPMAEHLGLRLLRQSRNRPFARATRSCGPPFSFLRAAPGCYRPRAPVPPSGRLP